MTLKEFLENIEQYQNDKQEHLAITIQDRDEVSFGNLNDCNLEYCKEHNIPVYDRKGCGGTIVHATGSIGVDYIYSHDKFLTFVSVDLINALYRYFLSKNLNAVIDGNDILIDGYKVCSCAENNLPPDFKWCNSVVMISINQNLELINNVCLKPMTKVPKALSDYGITTEEMVNFVTNWFKDLGVVALKQQQHSSLMTMGQ